MTVTKTSVNKRRTKKKIVQNDWPMTNFREEPNVGNPNQIEEGDFVVLGRSMLILDGNALWLGGISVRVNKLTELETGIVIAEVSRQDGTTAQLYACWLNPIFEESKEIIIE